MPQTTKFCGFSQKMPWIHRKNTASLMKQLPRPMSRVFGLGCGKGSRLFGLNSGDFDRHVGNVGQGCFNIAKLRRIFIPMAGMVSDSER